MEDNRRRWPRLDIAVAVQLSFSSVEAAVTAQTVNLSREGLFIATSHPRPVGTTVHARIRLDDTGQVFELEGTVVRVSEGRPASDGRPAERPGMGVLLKKTVPGWIEFCEKLERSRA
jgi:uncharacterized protein (TIGR02266 family)